MFDDMVARLKKEMSADELTALYARDKDSVYCVLCRAYIPGGAPGGIAVCYHHIEPRKMGGGSPNALPNLAPTCHPHHQEPLQSYRQLWWHAMVKRGLAKPEDYPLLEYPNQTAMLYPPTMECMGLFGFGTKVLKPDEVLQKVFTGRVDKRLDNWCVDACLQADRCLVQTRRNRRKEIQ